MNKKTFGFATTLVMLFIISVFQFDGINILQNDQPNEAGSFYKQIQSNNQIQVKTGETSNSAHKERVSPWTRSPFDTESAAMLDSITPEGNHEYRLLNPVVAGAAPDLLCHIELIFAKDEFGNRALGPQGNNCSRVGPAQVQESVRILEQHSSNGDLDATLFLSTYWRLQAIMFASGKSNLIEANSVIKDDFSASAENSPSVAPAEYSEIHARPRSAAIDQELVKIEQRLLKFSESGESEIFFALANIYAAKEPTDENIENMLTHQLLGEMRLPDVRLTSVMEASLTEISERFRNGIRQKAESILSKCCRN